MPTVIDSLIVTLGLDPAKYKKGSDAAKKDLRDTRTEAEKTAKEMALRGEQGALFFSKMRNEALALLAVFTAGVGLKTFIADTITGAAALGRMSSDLGTSTEELGSWQRAAERAGGSADGITQQLRQSQQAVAAFKLGTLTDDEQAFLRWGGDTKDLATGNQYLLARSKIISDMFKIDPGKAQLIAGQMAIDQEEFDFLKQGPAAVLALVDAQKKRQVVTQADADAAQVLNNKWLDLRDTAKSIGTRVAIALIPAFDRILIYAQRIADWMTAHPEVISHWVDVAVKSITEFADKADQAAAAVGGWQNVLIALGALKLLSLTGDILGLAAGLFSIGRALAYVATGGAAVDIITKLLNGKSGAPAAPAPAAAAKPTVAPEAGVPVEAVAPAVEAGAGAAGAAAEAGGAAAGVAGATALAGLLGGVAGMLYAPRGKNNEDALLASHNRAAQGAVKMLMDRGWSRAQAAGIVARLYRESNGLDSGARGDGGSAYGLAQWHPARQADFFARYKTPIEKGTFEQQIDFVDYELRQGSQQAAGRALAQTKTPEDATEVFTRQDERPADWTKGIFDQKQLAAALARPDIQNAAPYVPPRVDEAAARRAQARMIMDQSTQDAADNFIIGQLATTEQPQPGPVGNGPVTNTTEVRVGDIHVYTQAKSAAEIGHDIGDAIRRNTFGSLANAGVF